MTMEDRKDTEAEPVIPTAKEQQPMAAATAVKGEKPATEPETSDPEDLARTSPLQQLFQAADSHDHDEIWGVTLADPEKHVPSQVVFQKYLNANDGDVAAARDQLTKTLTWRAEKRPLELIKKSFAQAKFEGLGYVTKYTGDEVSGPEGREVFTWNVYGIVKDFEKTFGDLQEFIDWRTALMELAMQELDIASATDPITADNDPYKIYQVHDYKSVSFFSQSSTVRAASKETISVFAQNYPELLKEKFFINVPMVMGFMYGVIKMFVAAKTAKKFHPMSNGGGLASEFADSKVKGLGEMLPKAYGGKGEDLDKQGKTTELI